MLVSNLQCTGQPPTAKRSSPKCQERRDRETGSEVTKASALWSLPASVTVFYHEFVSFPKKWKPVTSLERVPAANPWWSLAHSETFNSASQTIPPGGRRGHGGLNGSPALLPIVMLRGIHQMLAAPDTRTQQDEDRCGPLFRRRHGYMNTAGRPPWLDSISSCVLRSLCHSRNRHTCCPQDPCVRAAAPHRRRDGCGCQAGLPAACARSCG